VARCQRSSKSRRGPRTWVERRFVFSAYAACENGQGVAYRALTDTDEDPISGALLRSNRHHGILCAPQPAKAWAPHPNHFGYESGSQLIFSCVSFDDVSRRLENGKSGETRRTARSLLPAPPRGVQAPPIDGEPLWVYSCAREDAADIKQETDRLIRKPSAK
jgi:hypothetical protein